jgi:predicted SAM-dependent methyltransferase
LLIIFIHIQNKFHSLKQWYKNLFKRSETSKVRKSLEKFCIGNGIDIGFGGDPITPSAICVDLHAPYAQYKKNPLHLKGSGDNLYWFNNSVLDYVYSSHLLEDFVDTKIVLEEWLRVLKPSGKLVLFLPDEQRYRLDCERKGKLPNQNHIHDHFSLNYVKTLLVDRTDIKIIHEVPLSHTYSFELVIEKIT